MISKCKIEKGVQRFACGTPQEFSVDGYYVTIPNDMGTSTTFVKNIHEAFSLVGKFDNEYESIKKRSEDIARYLTSDEGRWGIGS